MLSPEAALHKVPSPPRQIEVQERALHYRERERPLEKLALWYAFLGIAVEGEPLFLEGGIVKSEDLEGNNTYLRCQSSPQTTTPHLLNRTLIKSSLYKILTQEARERRHVWRGKTRRQTPLVFGLAVILSRDMLFLVSEGSEVSNLAGSYVTRNICLYLRQRPR